ncbi:MAG: AbrB/MazE/SpoVT family DNA-binding domain-containing protein [Candidatus Brocadiia bacterium]|jgi:AbrB family looped-hinge helix DNA binding protein
MPVSTISVKGQITLPIAFRRKLGIKPHDRIVIELEDKAIVVKRAPDLFEFAGVAGKALPPEEEERRMLKAVAAHVRGIAR